MSLMVDFGELGYESSSVSEISEWVSKDFVFSDLIEGVIEYDL